MMKTKKNLKALIITGKFVQDIEYIYPFYRLQEACFKVDVAVRGKEEVLGVNGIRVVPTRDIEGIKVKDYDLLILPGGARALEYIRQDREVLDFINKFDRAKKIIGSICHGSQLLISAKVIRGRRISGYYSIRDDIENAGATYVDQPCVIDGNIVSSPHYKYLGDWMKGILSKF